MWDFLCYAWNTALDAKAAKQKQQQEQKLQKQLQQQQKGGNGGAASTGGDKAVDEVVLDDDDDDDVMNVSDTADGHGHTTAAAGKAKAPSTPRANGGDAAGGVKAEPGQSAVDAQLASTDGRAMQGAGLKGEAEAGGTGVDTASLEGSGAGISAAGAQPPAVCIPLPVATSQECTACAEALGLASAQRSRVKREVEEERQLLGNLAADVLPALEVAQQYALVPR